MYVIAQSSPHKETSPLRRVILQLLLKKEYEFIYSEIPQEVSVRLTEHPGAYTQASIHTNRRIFKPSFHTRKRASILTQAVIHTKKRPLCELNVLENKLLCETDCPTLYLKSSIDLQEHTAAPQETDLQYKSCTDPQDNYTIY